MENKQDEESRWRAAVVADLKSINQRSARGDFILCLCILGLFIFVLCLHGDL